MATVPRNPDDLRAFLLTFLEHLNALRTPMGLPKVALTVYTVEDCAFWGMLIVEHDSGALRDQPIDLRPMHLDEVKMNLGMRRDEFRSRGELVATYSTNAKSLATVATPQRLAEIIMSEFTRKEISLSPPSPDGVVLPRRKVAESEPEVAMTERRKLLEDLKSRVLALRTAKTEFDDKTVDLIENRIIEGVAHVFGPASAHAKTVKNYKIWKGGYNLNDSWPERQRKFDDGIADTVQLLDAMIADLPNGSSPDPVAVRRVPVVKNKVFIVHGQNHDVRNKIELYLMKDLGLQSVVMEAGAHGGRTLPEKFEEMAAECAFSVFILSADDHLKDVPSGKELKRARQNVILEVGFFWGKLGRRERVAFLVEADPLMELPSDIQGVGYIPITPDLGETKLRLLKELKAAGLVG